MRKPVVRVVTLALLLAAIASRMVVPLLTNLADVAVAKALAMGANGSSYAFLSQAERQLEAATRQDSFSERVLLHKGTVLALLGRPPDAAVAWQQARVSGRHIVDLAAHFRQRKQFDHALSLMKAMRLTGTAVSSALCQTGLVFYQQGDLKGALQAFREAASQDQWDAIWEQQECLYQFGLTALEGKQPEDAVKWLDASLSISESKAPFASMRQQAMIHLKKGEAYQMLGQLNSAQEEYALARTLDPGNGWSLVRVGMLLMVDDPANAVLAFEQGIVQERDWYQQVQIAMAIGYYFQTRSLSDDARSWFRRAIDIWPQGAWAYASLGDSYYRSNDFREALSDYELAAKLDPQNAEFQVRPGWALVSLGDVRDAIGYFEKAVKISPNQTTYYPYLADAYTRIGKFEEAIITYRRILDLDPSNGQAADALRNLFE